MTKAPFKVHRKAWACALRGGKAGRPGLRVGEVVTMASIPEPRRGPGFQVWAGPRILWPGELSLGGQGADNGRAAALISARRPSPSCSGPGGPPPGARTPAPHFLPATPRPPARRGRRKSLVGWPRQRHARPGPGKQRGDVCGPKSGNGAPVGAGPGAGLLLGAHCSPSAQPHALHKKLTHPAAGHQPLDSGRRGALAGGGLLMG